MKKVLALATAVAVGLGIYGLFLWTFCRIEVPAGHMAIVTAKTGDPLPAGEILAERGQQGIWRDPLPEGRYFLNPVEYSWKIVPNLTVPAGKVVMVTSRTGRELPSGQILAADKSGKGVWRNVLGPGTYRLNPYGYATRLLDAVSIPIGYVGIVTSQTGKPAKKGEFAKPGEQGVLEQTLAPGLYYINPRAYQVDVIEVGMNQVTIVGEAGSVVVTKSQIQQASGGTVVDQLQAVALERQNLNRANYMREKSEEFVSQGQSAEGRGRKQKVSASGSWSSKLLGGVSRAGLRSKSCPEPEAEEKSAALAEPVAVLAPGGSRVGAKAEGKPKSVQLALDNASAFALKRFVEFPSRDGFQIMLDMTVEFELLPDQVSRVYMLYGDLPAVVEKIILPQILSVSRLKGSTYKARDFIDGEGRQQFQEQLREELVSVLKEKHILVHNAIIRHVEIPSEILTPIRESSLAQEQNLTNLARQETAQQQALLNTQVALVDQNRAQVLQETEKLIATIQAETKKSIALIRAEAERSVAGLELERSKLQAEITAVRGDAEVQSKYLVTAERAKGEQLRAAVFKDRSNFGRLKFVDALGEDLSVRVLHAGPGTLWTDLKGLQPALPVPAKQ
ncbi:MAG: SPFH domain-containing protein [Kiritimatiellia bacterium]